MWGNDLYSSPHGAEYAVHTLSAPRGAKLMWSAPHGAYTMSAEMTQSRGEENEETDAENLAATDGKVGIRETESSMDGRGARGW